MTQVRSHGWRQMSTEALCDELDRLDTIPTDGNEALEAALAAYADDIAGELDERYAAEPQPDSPALDPAGPWGMP